MALKPKSERQSAEANPSTDPGQEAATAEPATELAEVKVIENKAAAKTEQGRKVETLMQVSVLEKQQKQDPVKAAQDIAEQTAIIRNETIFAANSKMGWSHLTKLLFSGEGRLENAKQVEIQVKRDDLAAAQVAIEGFIQIHMLAGNYKMRTSKGTNRLLLGDNDDPELEMIMAYRQMHLGESMINSEFEKAWNDPVTQGIVDKLKEAIPSTWLKDVDGDVLMIALYRQEQGHSMMEYIMATKDPATEEGFNVIRIRARDQGSRQAAAA